MATTPSLDHVVDTTPNDRNRVVDAVRAGSILVVVLWHWSMSVLRWNDGGALTMPNPIDKLPGAWLATWVLQVMPLFFVVGGYANLTSLRHRSHSLAEFGGSTSCWSSPSPTSSATSGETVAVRTWRRRSCDERWPEPGSGRWSCSPTWAP